MLAINTAFMQANLALTVGGKSAFRDLNAECKHSEHVLSAIDELCEEVGVEIHDIKELAVVVGPGSFTGLRIGVAIAKALACANQDVKLLPLTSLELMAYIVHKHGLANGDFVCAINALSGLYFVARFNENGMKIQEEKMIEQAEFSAIKEPIFAISGDIESVQGIEISARELLEFAQTKHTSVPISEFKPMYLRLSQAEDELLKKNKKRL